MTTSDVTRHLDQPEKQYVGVRLEQGRVFLDADFNEESRIRDVDRQNILLDFVGPQGSPDDGFSPGVPLPLADRAPAQPAALLEGSPLAIQTVAVGGVGRFVHAVSLRAGTIYLGGKAYNLASPEHVAFQRGYLQMKASSLPTLSPAAPPPQNPRSPVSPSPGAPDSPISPYALYSPASPGSPGSPSSPVSPSSPETDRFPRFSNFYYLRAWEQEVFAVEDEEIREVALSGADATSRLRRMHRVELAGNLPRDVDTCEKAFNEVIRRLETRGGVYDRATGELRSRGRLGFRFEAAPARDCSPCEVSPTARFLGSENVTIRVMLTARDRYVWAEDNGAPLYRVKVTGLSGNGDVVVTMLTPPKDLEHQPRGGRVVEVLPFAAVLDGAELLDRQDPHFQKIADEVGAFARVRADYDPVTKSFVVERGRGTTEMAGFVTQWDSRHPAVSQLNHADPEGSDARYFFLRVWHVADSVDRVEIPTWSPTPLGQTGIVPVFHQQGMRGDSWTASFRVDAPERCVPFDLLSAPAGVPPHGARHYYAPLFLLRGSDQYVDEVHDCRTRMRRANDQSCATRSVGDGVTSFGEYATIQDAVDSLPASGGIIEVRPGTHLGPVVVQGRRNVSIAGCGQSIVLSPEVSAGAALFELRSSAGIEISGLILRAVEQSAVHAEDVQGLGLRASVLESGTYVDGAFVGGGGSSLAELVHLERVRRFQMRDLIFYAGRRPSVSLESCVEGTVQTFQVVSEPISDVPPGRPAFFVAESESIRIMEGRIEAAGQVGVDVNGGSSIALRNLVLESEPHRLSGGSVSQETLPAIRVTEADGVDVQQCRLLMAQDRSVHACLSLQGSNLVVEESFIEVLADLEGIYRAWGGVEIRGGTAGVTLRNNRITGGLGHGVTLGSVEFGSPPPEPTGPGTFLVDWGGPPSNIPRVQGDLRERAVNPTALLSRVRILGNTIENMGTNGISALSVLGLPSGVDFLTTRGLVIEGNSIRGNVRQPFVGMSNDTSLLPFSTNASPPRHNDLALNLLPRGGVVLAVVEDSADIRGNSISSNGPPDSFDTGGASVPICGVFVLIGDSMSITDNRVADNGAVIQSSFGIPWGIERGVRAGIAVMLAGTATRPSKFGVFPPEPSSPEHYRGRGDVEDLLDDGTGLDSAQQALCVARNAVRHPEGRAIQVVGSGAMSIDANFFSSQGNHKGQGVIERGMVGDAVFVMDLGRPWEAQPNESGGFHFGPQQSGPLYGFFVQYITGTPSSPRQFLGYGGALSFCRNQVTYDWAAPSNDSPDGPLSHFAVAVLSLDHVSVSGNQVATDLGEPNWPYGPTSPSGTSLPTPLFGDVFVYGATTEVAQNRVSERVGNTRLSLVAFSELASIAACNQTTHYLVTFRTSEFESLQMSQRALRLEQSNQVLYAFSGSDYPFRSGHFHYAARAFGKLLRRATP